MYSISRPGSQTSNTLPSTHANTSERDATTNFSLSFSEQMAFGTSGHSAELTDIMFVGSHVDSFRRHSRYAVSTPLKLH